MTRSARRSAPGRIIPLMPGVSRGAGERREMLRAAVIQVVRHLVVRAVPPATACPAVRPGDGPARRGRLGPGRAGRGGRAGTCPGRPAAGAGTRWIPFRHDAPRTRTSSGCRSPRTGSSGETSAAVDAEKDATDSYTQERYTHADGTSHDHPRVPGGRVVPHHVRPRRDRAHRQRERPVRPGPGERGQASLGSMA